MISKEEWPGRHQSAMFKFQDALEEFQRGFVSVRALTPEQEAVTSGSTFEYEKADGDAPAPTLEHTSHILTTQWCETPEKAADEFVAMLKFPYPSIKHLFDLYWRRMPELKRETDFESNAEMFRASARYVVAVHKVIA